MKLRAIPIPMPIMIPTGSTGRDISAAQWWLLGGVITGVALVTTAILVWLWRRG